MTVRNQVIVFAALAIFSLHPAAASAQGFLLKGGFLVSNLSVSDPTSNFEQKTGLIGGFGFGGNRDGRVGVQGDLLLSQRGAKVGGGGEYKQWAVEVPIVLRVNAGSSSLSGIAPYAYAGPSGTLRFKRQFKPTLGQIIDVKDQTEAIDISLVLAGGIEITRLGVEVRYSRGYRNVFTDAGATAGTAKAKDTSFAVMGVLRLR
jgi:hypothetical protein